MTEEMWLTCNNSQAQHHREHAVLRVILVALVLMCLYWAVIAMWPPHLPDIISESTAAQDADRFRFLNMVCAVERRSWYQPEFPRRARVRTLITGRVEGVPGSLFLFDVGPETFGWVRMPGVVYDVFPGGPISAKPDDSRPDQ